MTDPQTLQESNIVVDGLADKLDSLNETMTKVLEQTTKTNGRVNRLEGWREGAIWALAGTVVIGSLALSAYAKNIQSDMQSNVQANLSDYINTTVNNRIDTAIDGKFKDVPDKVVERLKSEYNISIK